MFSSALAIIVLAGSGQPGLPVYQAVIEDVGDGDTFCVDCCSMYCGAAPEIRVSSHLAAQGTSEYGDSKIDDGLGETAWVVSGGVGEWFEFVFVPEGFHPDVPEDNRRLGVNSLAVWNGYNKSLAHWSDHGRVRELEVSVDGSAVAILRLHDDRRPQRVDLPPTFLRRGMRFRFTVRRLYLGARFRETALSEVRLDGFGHH